MWLPRQRRKIRMLTGRSLRRFAVAFFLLVIAIHVFFRLTEPAPSAYDPRLYRPDSDYPESVPSHPSLETLNVGKIFIAALHWNTAHVLRGYWNANLLDLVKHLGAKNVYVSIYENGSFDDTKGALKELDEALRKLGVERSIVMENESHKDLISQKVSREDKKEGWVWTSRGRMEIRRIPMLAQTRNKSLEPLKKVKEKWGEKFDRILFLNDVVFSVNDVYTLLNTRNGNYSAVCSVDYMRPFQVYDTFALRDSNGLEPASLRYPFFAAGPSRNAILSSQPVPVKSCWNGIVAFDAAPFIRDKNPLRFRATPDSLSETHLEGSECCLVHADNDEPNPSRSGIWVNGQIRVGYTVGAYRHARDHLNTWEEWARGVPVRIVTRILGLPWRKPSIKSRVKSWTAAKGSGHRHEPGDFCLVDEMHVLVSNGWKHV